MAILSAPPPVVPEGTVAYRHRISRRGALLAFVVPVMLGAAGGLMLWRSGSAVRGSAGFLLTAMAAPTMLLVGVPVSGGWPRYALAVGTSLVLWWGIGSWATRRAMKQVVLSWRDWWREYLWLAVPVWLGTAVAFVVAYRLVL